MPIAVMDNDSDMENAINELDAANPPSLRSVALKWGVKRSTLTGRMKEAKARQQAQSKLQLLTPTQVSIVKRLKQCSGRPSKRQKVTTRANKENTDIATTDNSLNIGTSPTLPGRMEGNHQNPRPKARYTPQESAGDGGNLSHKFHATATPSPPHPASPGQSAHNQLDTNMVVDKA
jgi:hypothetical protein